MSIKQNFPAIKPTLNLDFANSRAVDSRIQFTRASAATVTDAQGILQTVSNNKPRIDFDPITGECKGLLIEEQRSNVMTYSTSFENDWGIDYGAYLIRKCIKAPDGTMTGNLLKCNGTSASARLYGGVPTAGTWTTSFYVKQGTAPKTSLWVYQGGWVISYNFTWSSGVLYNDSVGPIITSVGDGWYRVSCTYTTTGSNAGVYVAPNNYGSSSINDSNYYWGFQTEAGTFATSYIPTTVTFVSRNSSATYLDSTGVLRTAGINQARYGYGYDSATQKWVSQGLILEPAATNLIIRSDCQANWSIPNIGYTYSTQTTAPDGSTIYSINKNSTYQLMRLGGLFDTASISYPATYTLSFWAKTLSGTGTLTWDIGDSTTATGAASLTTTWQRFTYTFTASSASTFPSGGFIDLTMPDNSTYAIWGVQLETGGTATSLVQTFGATATRAADISSSAATTRASEDAFINNITPWYNVAESTLYAEGDSITGNAVVSTNPGIVQLDDGTNTNRYAIRRFSNATAYDAINSGLTFRLASTVNSVTTNFDAFPPTSQLPVEWDDANKHKAAFAIKLNTQAAYADGVSAQLTSETAPIYSTPTRMAIGSCVGAAPWNGHISKVAYYSKFLSNTQLQALTA